MPITKNTKSRLVLSKSVVVSLADVATGVAQDAIDLPINSLIVGGTLDVVTAFDSVTSDVVDVVLGSEVITASADVSVIDVSTQLNGSNTATTAVSTPVTFEWTGVGGSESEGTVRLTVNYVVNSQHEDRY